MRPLQGTANFVNQGGMALESILCLNEVLILSMAPRAYVH